MTTSRHALAFVVITVLVDVIGFGIVLPVLPRLLVEISGSDIARSSRLSGYLLVVFAAMQLLCAPLLGNLSDRFGRRPILLLSLAVYALNYLIMGLANSIGLLFIGRILTGAAGATTATANAFIADISASDERAGRFGLMGVAFGLGFVVGPLLGGILGEFGVRVPFFAAAALALVNLAYGALVLPETLPRELRRPLSLRRANPIGALTALRRQPLVGAITGAVLFYHVGHFVYPSVWSFYAMEKFAWSSAEIGYSLGAVGVAAALVQGGLIRWAIPRLGAPRTALTGLGCAALAYVSFAFASGAVEVYLSIAISGLAGLAMPALQAIMADATPEDGQGELQGALASISSLAALIGPLVMTQVFAAFAGPDAVVYFPGAPFLLAAGLTVVTLMLLAPALVGLMAAQPDSE